MRRKFQLLILNQPPQQVCGNENPFDIQPCTLKKNYLVPLYKFSACYSVQFPSQITSPYHSIKQWIATHPVTHKPKYQRPYFDAPLRNSGLATLLIQQHTRKGCWSTFRPVALLSVWTRLFLTATIVLVTSTPPNSVPSFIQIQIQQCRLVVQSPFVDSSSSACNRDFSECVPSP
jgi:hypothetical protein